MRCVEPGCGWIQGVNGRPGAEDAARGHRNQSKAQGKAHCDFLFIQYAEVRV